jgi:hypothetical protein
MTVRCKFRCESKTERRSYGNNEPQWDYEFSPVSGGSDENKRFWKYTPGGLFKVSSVNDGKFVVGTEYYIDITAATPEPVAVGYTNGDDNPDGA